MDTITLPFKQFLQRETSHGECAIPPLWAELIIQKTGNSPESGYYVQFTDENEQTLDYPVLWPYYLWADDQERTKRQKAWSEKQRQERFVFEYNHKLVTKGVMKEFSLPENMASMVAMKYLKKQNNSELLKYVGIDELVTDIKDIP